MSDQLRFNALASAGKGDELYRMIVELCDITCGRAQDRLQQKNVEVTLQPSDSVSRVISQIELKWWLFKHNRMYCHNNLDTGNDLEGVRQMLLMLGKGPPAFAVQATLELPQLSPVLCPDATAWMKARTDHLLRYGEQLMTQFSSAGALHAALPEDPNGTKIVERQPWIGQGCDVEDNTSVSFHGKKYIQQLVDKFLPGEMKPERGSSSRESIMQLPAEPLPPLGSPEDLALEPVQHECRAIGGGLAHLSRIRIDLAFDHAWISQGTARPTPKHLEHFKELLRYAWSTINLCHQILLERRCQAGTFERARGSGCGAVYDTVSIPYRPRYIARSTPKRAGRVGT